MGLSQRRLADLVGFGCLDTVADWEGDTRTRTPRRLKQFFEEAGQPFRIIDLAAGDFAGRRFDATCRAWATRRARRRT